MVVREIGFLMLKFFLKLKVFLFSFAELFVILFFYNYRIFYFFYCYYYYYYYYYIIYIYIYYIYYIYSIYSLVGKHSSIP
jgi:hypothetical protein